MTQGRIVAAHGSFSRIRQCVPGLIYRSLCPLESAALDGILIGSVVFADDVPKIYTQKEQTTDHATSVEIGRIYATHAIWP